MTFYANRSSLGNDMFLFVELKEFIMNSMEYLSEELMELWIRKVFAFE